ncbi:MAG: hypothetical protein IT372_11510 [Polyangiaceae bacterium]|nr:hypothetical protein [Polyangiaceae bacterium]
MADRAPRPGAPDGALERADQSVSTRFTRIMNATTSRWGVATDPPLVATASAVFFLAFLGALGAGMDALVVRALAALAALPIVVAVLVSLGLLGARRRVVTWLAAQPFPIENMNAVLNGLGEALEVTFEGAPPAAADVNRELDKVHPDAFVTGGVEDARTLDVRIGVVDSKRNPSASNHRRYARVRELVERVLVPLSAQHPITSVRVK